MPQQLFHKSPLQQRLSRKVYDYLGQQARSAQKQYKNRPLISQVSPYSKEATQYQLIVEFELRREKQKTLILQERLRNKESFIKQMKEFQDELTVAFEKCQQQLQFYRTQCQEYENRSNNSFPTFNNGIVSQNITMDGLMRSNDPAAGIPGQEQMIREYVQEIAQLKHLVIRLEEEINFYEKKQKYGNHNKYMSSSVNNKDMRVSDKDVSTFKQAKNANNPKQRKSTHQDKSSPTKHKQPQQPTSTIKQKKQRSKTLANQFVQQKHQQNFTTYTKITEFIQQQSRKISSFITHFLTMCEFFDESISRQPTIGHKLKKAWKWVKGSIVEWNYLKGEKVEKVREYKIGNLVAKMLPVGNLTIKEVEQLLERMTKPQSQTITKRMRAGDTK